MNHTTSAHTTARILAEALPYIRRYRNKTIVIKYGGHAFGNDELQNSFARDVILMKLVGMKPVVVHGGGPQINQALAARAKKSKFVNGLRITDADTISVVAEVLAMVNKNIVQLVDSFGGRAVGICGDAIRARKLVGAGGDYGGVDDGKVDDAKVDYAKVDYGYVGEIDSVNTKQLDAQDAIPIIAPLGIGADDKIYNINADSVAGEIATALAAEKLILLTNTRGVLDAGDNLIAELNAVTTSKMIKDGGISGGMIPKVECALAAVNAGVASALIVDGRVAHALLLELFTDAGVGTQIRK